MISSCSRDLSPEEVEERGKQFDSTLDADHSGVAERRFFNIVNNKKTNKNNIEHCQQQINKCKNNTKNIFQRAASVYGSKTSSLGKGGGCQSGKIKYTLILNMVIIVRMEIHLECDGEDENVEDAVEDDEENENEDMMSTRMRMTMRVMKI